MGDLIIPARKKVLAARVKVQRITQASKNTSRKTREPAGTTACDAPAVAAHQYEARTWVGWRFDLYTDQSLFRTLDSSEVTPQAAETIPLSARQYSIRDRPLARHCSTVC